MTTTTPAPSGERDLPPLTPDELRTIYHWLQRTRLAERRTLGEATLHELEAIEERVHALWLEANPITHGGRT